MRRFKNTYPINSESPGAASSSWHVLYGFLKRMSLL